VTCSRSEASSPASAGSTSASSVPVCELCGFASRTRSASGSSPSTGPGCPCTRTSGQWRLTEEQKLQAVKLYEAGESTGQVAARYGVSRQSMWDVLRRRTQMRDRIEALPRKEPTALREKRLASLRRYRSRAARITRAQIDAVKERDGTCRMCGGAGTDVDHILPVAQGGQTDMENLQLLCNPCHIQKSRADRKGVVPMEASSTSNESMSSVEASRERARTSPSPAAARGSTGHARVFGASTPDWFANYDRGTWWSRTLELFSPEGLTAFSGTWPRAGMTRSGIAYRLRPLAPLTGGTGSGSLPTPSATMADRGGRGDLIQVVRGNPSPSGHFKTGGTPTARDWKDTGDMTNVPENGLLGRQVLNRESWPTPTASEHTGPGHSTKGGKNLRTVVSEREWPTPTVNDALNQHAPPSQWDRNSDALPTAVKRASGDAPGKGNGSLNPTWVEWLMNFPLGWTEVE
jgi:5-methylcytosine-specific restriction endonuclease McrA